MSEELSAINDTLRRLRAETSGVAGEVMKRTRPELYAHKSEQINQLTRRYFHYLFSAESTAPK